VLAERFIHGAAALVASPDGRELVVAKGDKLYRARAADGLHKRLLVPRVGGDWSDVTLTDWQAR
jgi:hypothetical protein